MKTILAVLAASTLAWSAGPDKRAGLSPAATRANEALRTEGAFEVKGTLEKRTATALTLRRPNLPAAVLSLRPQTEVLVDGKKAQPRQLEHGVQVRALFQLDGEKIVALRVEAKSESMEERATGGAGLEEELKSDLDRMGDLADPSLEAEERESKEPTGDAVQPW